jgi:hypothetical protein
VVGSAKSSVPYAIHQKSEFVLAYQCGERFRFRMEGVLYMEIKPF